MSLTHGKVVLPFLRSTFFISLTFLCVFHFRKSVKQQHARKKIWEETFPSFERNILLHELFELFLTYEEMERTCLESTNYARLKGEYNFTMTLDKSKAFTAILLVSGYTELPRQEKYWERSEDGHNFLVSSMMSKNEFE